MPSCQDCGYFDGVNEDPRTPPLDTGSKVLCDDCYAAAKEERIEELQHEIDLLKAD